MTAPSSAYHQIRRAGGLKSRRGRPRSKAEDPTIHQGPQPEEVDTPLINTIVCRANIRYPFPCLVWKDIRCLPSHADGL
jgi:hypothetical protein